jgi:hypothetical protein
MEARHKVSPTLLCSIGALLLGGLIACDVAAAEVYRWVDENGEVHYSESLPPDYQDKGFDVLNQEGIVTDENQKLTPEPPPEPPPDEQKRSCPATPPGCRGRSNSTRKPRCSSEWTTS